MQNNKLLMFISGVFAVVIFGLVIYFTTNQATAPRLNINEQPSGEIIGTKTEADENINQVTSAESSMSSNQVAASEDIDPIINSLINSATTEQGEVLSDDETDATLDGDSLTNDFNKIYDDSEY